jgi:hypothetical protein
MLKFFPSFYRHSAISGAKPKKETPLTVQPRVLDFEFFQSWSAAPNLAP